jgi:hypothetical protein
LQKQEQGQFAVGSSRSRGRSSGSLQLAAYLTKIKETRLKIKEEAGVGAVCSCRRQEQLQFAVGSLLDKD